MPTSSVLGGRDIDTQLICSTSAALPCPQLLTFCRHRWIRRRCSSPVCAVLWSFVQFCAVVQQCSVVLLCAVVQQNSSVQFCAVMQWCEFLYSCVQCCASVQLCAVDKFCEVTWRSAFSETASQGVSPSWLIRTRSEGTKTQSAWPVLSYCFLHSYVKMTSYQTLPVVATETLSYTLT